MESPNNIGGPKIVGSDMNGVASIAFNGQTTQVIEILNQFPSKLAWSSEITYGNGVQGWLRLNPSAGHVAGNKTGKIEVSVDTAGLQPKKTYTATALFSWDAPPAGDPDGTLVVKLTTT